MILSFPYNCQQLIFENMKAITRNKNSNKEVIISWFEGRIKDEELTDHQKEYWDRVQTCHASQLKLHARKRTINMLCKRFDLSRATAQRLYADTEEIIGSQRKSNKEFKRLIAEEMAKATYRKARQLDSPGLMVKALHAYIRATGIEMEDSDIPAFNELEPADVYTMLPPTIEKHLLEQLAEGVINLNAAPKTIDIDHEEIS